MADTAPDLPDDIDALHALVLEQRAELALARSGLMEQRYEIEVLKARLARLLRATFGQSFEKLRSDIEQLELLLADREEQAAETEPTIVFKGDRPYLVVGAPGATYITMGNLQVMLNVIDFGMTAEAAAYAPRFAAVSDTIELSNRVLRACERSLLSEGYKVKRHAESYLFAWVHAIRITDNGMDGGADPATGGLVVAV